ncbi:MAG: YbaB/EbfC family nucleoid-associated protein [Malacoplasma sp.]|nr:YbaB/EbfC family nucleoid-associated protein [Malacoplasma sp.]
MSQLNQAMQVLRKLHEQQKKNQSALQDKKYQFASQQDLVKVEMNGKFEIISLSINGGLIDADDIITLEEMVSDTVADCTKLILKDYEDAVPAQLKQIYAMDPSNTLNAKKKEWNDKSFNYECADENITVVIRGSMIIEKIKIVNTQIVDLAKKSELENILKSDLTDALSAVYDSWDENNNATISSEDLF